MEKKLYSWFYYDPKSDVDYVGLAYLDRFNKVNTIESYLKAINKIDSADKLNLKFLEVDEYTGDKIDSEYSHKLFSNENKHYKDTNSSCTLIADEDYENIFWF